MKLWCLCLWCLCLWCLWWRASLCLRCLWSRFYVVLPLARNLRDTCAGAADSGARQQTRCYETQTPLIAAIRAIPMPNWRSTPAHNEVAQPATPTGEHKLPACFARGMGHDCPTCSAYAQGSWKPTSEAPTYRLHHALWKQMSVRGMPPNTNHHWGVCDDIASSRSGPASRMGSRRRYTWVPRNCALRRFDRASACRMLRGQQVLVAGDSATAQFFLSLVLQLGGAEALGHNKRGGSAVLKDLTASACGDTVRLNFVRNDLLLWTSQVEEMRELGKSCTAGRALLQPFANRVADADLLILGTGHHYPHVEQPPGEETSDAVFVRSLNHTLSRVVSVRAAAGHGPGSVVLLGPPAPVAGCSRYSRPITMVEALSVNSSLAKWSRNWQITRGYGVLAKALAAELGFGFLDVAPLSVQRPDDTLGRWCRLAGFDCYKRLKQIGLQKHHHQAAKQAARQAVAAAAAAAAAATAGKGAGRRLAPSSSAAAAIDTAADYWEEDCLHTCLPGPVDEYVRLLFNLLPGRATRTAVARGGNGNGRFFGKNLSSWLYTEGAENLEPCANASNPACAFMTPEQGLTHCAPWAALPTALKGRAFPWVQAGWHRTRKREAKQQG